MSYLFIFAIFFAAGLGQPFVALGLGITWMLIGGAGNGQ